MVLSTYNIKPQNPMIVPRHTSLKRDSINKSPSHKMLEDTQLQKILSILFNLFPLIPHKCHKWSLQVFHKSLSPEDIYNAPWPLRKVISTRKKPVCNAKKSGNLSSSYKNTKNNFCEQSLIGSWPQSSFFTAHTSSFVIRMVDHGSTNLPVPKFKRILLASRKNINGKSANVVLFTTMSVNSQNWYGKIACGNITHIRAAKGRNAILIFKI